MDYIKCSNTPNRGEFENLKREVNRNNVPRIFVGNYFREESSQPIVSE